MTARAHVQVFGNPCRRHRVCARNRSASRTLNASPLRSFNSSTLPFLVQRLMPDADLSAKICQYH